MSPGRVLVVAPNAPDYDRGSGARRTFDLITFLQDAGWSVTFAASGWCLGSVPGKVTLAERYARILQQRGIATYAGLSSRTEQLIAESQFDLAILTYFHVAETWMPTIRRVSPSTRIIVDSLDLHLLRSARQIFRGRERMQHEENSKALGLLDPEYASLMIREMNAYSAADLVLTVSEKEAGYIADLSGEPALAHCVPDCEDLEPSQVPFDDRRGILFLGGFQHSPNVDAATYLCTMVVPQLDPSLLNEHPISIVGHGLEQLKWGMSGSSSHIRMVGWVPSVEPYLERSRVTVVPLPFGAGTKRKLIQTLMIGTPAVATSIAGEGLDLTDGEHVLLADDAVSFAGSITRLVQERHLWHSLADRGRRHIQATHGREAVRQRFLEAIRSVGGRRPKSSDYANRLEAHRPGDRSYYRLSQRLRGLIRDVVPPTATVLVVSKGDDELLNLEGRTAWHFPRARTGVYAGEYPQDSERAVAHLQELQREGADYFLLPHPYYWWLDYYEGLREHLERSCRLVASEDDAGMLFSLREPPPEVTGETSRRETTAPASERDSVSTAPALREPALATSPLPFQPDRNGSEVEEDIATQLWPEGRIPRAVDAVAKPPIVSHEDVINRAGAGVRGLQVLVLGTYRTDAASHIAQIVSGLNDTGRALVTQRWVSIGGEPCRDEVRGVTVESVSGERPTLQMLNGLVTREDLKRCDYVVMMGDDVVLPDRFLDCLLVLQERLAFALVQPGRTHESQIGFPLFEQQPGVLARETLLVAMVPVVSVHRSAFDIVFPLELEEPAGMSLERVWSYRLHERGLRQGIVDAVPVHYRPRQVPDEPPWREMNVQSSLFLREQRHFSFDQCTRVLGIVNAQDVEAPR